MGVVSIRLNNLLSDERSELCDEVEPAVDNVDMSG